jgi:hypothetical protein
MDKKADKAHKRRNELIQQYKIIHSSRPNYGRSSEVILGQIMSAFADFDGIGSVLDYGCGRSRTVDWLAKLLDAKAYRYDPAIPEYAKLPVQECDAVICTDVMEHIPQEDLGNVIAEIGSISQLVYFNICTREAGTILANGENAHCTVENPKWWLDCLQETFPLIRRVHSIRKQNVSFVTI